MKRILFSVLGSVLIGIYAYAQELGDTTHVTGFALQEHQITLKVGESQQLHISPADAPKVVDTLVEQPIEGDITVDFIPYRGDFSRGIFCTEVVKFDGEEGSATNPSAEQLAELYRTFYNDAAFTHYSDKALDLKQVVNTNKALVHVDKFGNKAVITSMIDNLLKGAVGQAVQNMNIMFSLDEKAGLNLKSSAF